MGTPTGGIGSLAVTLDTYWGAVEADFLRFYSVDLGEAVSDPSFGCRKLIDLIVHLPSEAATWRVQEPKEPSEGPAEERRVVTTDPNKISSWLSGHGVIG